jgi:hypothetical protein
MPHDASRLVSVASVATNRGFRDETQVPLFSAVPQVPSFNREGQEPIWGKKLAHREPPGERCVWIWGTRGGIGSMYKGDKPPRPFKSKEREASSVFAQSNP